MTSENMQQEHLESVAKLLKTMAHPIRLKILCLLKDKEMTVSDLREQVKTSNANVSQHLTILRNLNVLTFRKESNFIFNRIADGRVLELIQALQKLYCTN